MYESQYGMCLVCEEELPANKNVDHCHDTGKVRGLLCRACNIMIGHAEKRSETKEDAVRILKNAIELIEHNHKKL
jgi:DNA-binding sugar fermentation-stimulating protein